MSATLRPSGALKAYIGGKDEISVEAGRTVREMLSALNIPPEVIALVVVFYIRRWRLREEYSLLWLFLSAALIILTIDQGVMEWAARRLDVSYSPAVLFFLALAFVAVMLFHYSLEISRLSDQNKILAQEMSLLRAKLDGSGPRATSQAKAGSSEVDLAVADDDAL